MRYNTAVALNVRSRSYVSMSSLVYHGIVQQDLVQIPSSIVASLCAMHRHLEHVCCTSELTNIGAQTSTFHVNSLLYVKAEECVAPAF